MALVNVEIYDDLLDRVKVYAEKCEMDESTWINFVLYDALAKADKAEKDKKDYTLSELVRFK